MKPAVSKEIGCLYDNQNSQILKMWNVDVPPGKRILQQHQHLNFEIMYVNSGDGTYSTADKTYEISAGDVFVFSCNEMHCITEVGEKGLNITNLHFTPQFFINHLMDMNFFFHHSPKFSNRISCEENEVLSVLQKKICEELTENKDGSVLMIKSLLQMFVIYLKREFDYSDEMSISNPERQYSVRKAMEYIDTHFTEKLTLQEIASAAGLSSSYLSTVFKKMVGISPWDYVNSRRTEKAARLILSESCSGNMIYVSEECGFNNTANFNKAFRKYTGMTPSEYKAGGYAHIS